MRIVPSGINTSPLPTPPTVAPEVAATTAAAPEPFTQALTPVIKPTRYTGDNNQTFFSIGADTAVTVSYGVTTEKNRRTVIGHAVELKVDIDNGTHALTHRYTLPADLKVGAELPAIEQELYGFIQQASGVFAQGLQMKAVHEAMQQAENIALEHEDISIPDATQLTIRQQIRALEVQLLLATAGLSGITSMNLGGLQDYRRMANAQTQLALHTKNAQLPAHPTELIQAIMPELEAAVAENLNVKQTQARVYAHLERLDEASVLPFVITDDAAHIVHNFVPKYLDILARDRTAGLYPKSIFYPVTENILLGCLIFSCATAIAAKNTFILFDTNVLLLLASLGITPKAIAITVAGTRFGLPYLRASAHRLSFGIGRKARIKVLTARTQRQLNALPLESIATRNEKRQREAERKALRKEAREKVEIAEAAEQARIAQAIEDRKAELRPFALHWNHLLTQRRSSVDGDKKLLKAYSKIFDAMTDSHVAPNLVEIILEELHQDDFDTIAGVASATVKIIKKLDSISAIAPELLAQIMRQTRVNLDENRGNAAKHAHAVIRLLN